MKCSIPFPRRLALEVNRAAYRTHVLEHTLTQLFWECTLRCNLDCRHCGSDCRKTALLEDPPVEDLLGVLDSRPLQVDPGKILVITTGGEPLVRRDIADVGAEIKRRGYLWGMVTNGMLLSGPVLDSLMAAGLDSLAMSFDGFEDAHNWMRGSQLSFKRADAAIDLLTALGDSLTWDLITCVNRRNFDRIAEFRDYLISRGVKRWRIFTVAPMGRAVTEPDLFLSDGQFRQLMDFIAGTRRDGRIGLDFACEGFLGEYEGLVRGHYYNCIAGISVGSIRSDGSISGCLSIRSDYNQGNVHTDNFWDVWENRFQQFRSRRWMKSDACARCDAWRYCQGGGMHLRGENGEMLSCNYLKLVK
ncbi:MAG: TIGR04133 family radical SAM/SPASM protein [Bacteroidaceae bacterium]|nr:TIGR04133 family radical SAM/SPASM protein [Bacteroidaceae bacterium]